MSQSGRNETPSRSECIVWVLSTPDLSSLESLAARAVLKEAFPVA